MNQGAGLRVGLLFCVVRSLLCGIVQTPYFADAVPKPLCYPGGKSGGHYDQQTR